MTMLRRSSTRGALLRRLPLVDSIPGEIHAQGMWLMRRMILPLTSMVDRRRIMMIRGGRTGLMSCVEMLGEMRIRRRGDRK